MNDGVVERGVLPYALCDGIGTVLTCSVVTHSGARRTREDTAWVECEDGDREAFAVELSLKLLCEESVCELGLRCGKVREYFLTSE